MIRTIYDNYDLWDIYTDEDMTELARINNLIEDDEEPSDELLNDLRYEEDSIEWECTKAELDGFFKDKTVIFFGSVGRWDGTCDGGKVGRFEELFYEAIRDCDYIKFTDDNGALFLECSHHDGTNHFQIKELTRAGIEYFDRWQYGKDSRTERDAHRQIIKRYSRCPHFYERIYC